MNRHRIFQGLVLVIIFGNLISVQFGAAEN